MILSPASWMVAAATAPLLLAGFLPVDADVGRRWMLSGRWIYPVGNPIDFRLSAADSVPAYTVTRNVRRSPHDLHQGADLTNRRGGDPVRAAAHGIVVSATTLGNGYGHHVVLAHRLPGGELVYSVYAHLAPGSITVAAGDAVTFGQPLGRVGRSGLATSSHLHFEVRRPRHASVRWEKSEVADPLAFVAARLPTRGLDSTWAAPYLSWAELGGLIDPGEPADGPVSRARWRKTLVSALCRDEAFLTGPLQERPGPLPDRASSDTALAITWREVASDLELARSFGLCLPAGLPSEAERRAACRARLDQETPASHLRAVGRRKGQPTLAELTLLLSDLASD